MEKRSSQKNNLPLILIILDGWGIANPNRGNAIYLAKTNAINKLSGKYPFTKLYAHGKYVGLPNDQIGNSEAGHMNIGAGRIVDQDIIKINSSIKNGSFFTNATFLEAIRHVKRKRSKLHLMGMLSNGMSPHSDPAHLKALIELARKNNINDTNLHLFTDGRDSPKYTSLKLIESLERDFLKNEKIATVMGRFYAMDRKKEWTRTEMAYEALVLGKSFKAESPQAAITESYNRGESDEFILPYSMIHQGKILPRINDNDSVIFFNLRSDRARQLAKVFAQRNFQKMNPGTFKRKKILKDLRFVAMTDFGPDLDDILTAYPGNNLLSTLPMQLADLTQLYIAETEKYAHVTYFFNGGYSGKVANEEQMAISSPMVKSYDQVPAMSSKKLAEKVIKNLGSEHKKNYKYDFTVLNFAAPDMIGHTGNLKAGIECCRIIDKIVDDITRAYLKIGGTIIITADHGNIENMINLKTDEILTEHTTNQVPFILISDKLKGRMKLKSSGVLGDIAPTILHLLNKDKPKEMRGETLIK